jgi:uncharacterized protein YlaN (UPF0358 family)
MTRNNPNEDEIRCPRSEYVLPNIVYKIVLSEHFNTELKFVEQQSSKILLTTTGQEIFNLFII